MQKKNTISITTNKLVFTLSDNSVAECTLEEMQNLIEKDRREKRDLTQRNYEKHSSADITVPYKAYIPFLGYTMDSGGYTDLFGKRFNREKFYDGKNIIPIYIQEDFRYNVKLHCVRDFVVGDLKALEKTLYDAVSDEYSRIRSVPWHKRLFNNF